MANLTYHDVMNAYRAALKASETAEDYPIEGYQTAESLAWEEYDGILDSYMFQERLVDSDAEDDRTA